MCFLNMDGVWLFVVLRMVVRLMDCWCIFLWVMMVILMLSVLWNWWLLIVVKWSLVNLVFCCCVILRILIILCFLVCRFVKSLRSMIVWMWWWMWWFWCDCFILWWVCVLFIIWRWWCVIRLVCLKNVKMLKFGFIVGWWIMFW